MKGLEISQAFFREWGFPFLKAEYPELVERAAVGRMMGSDVIGADDEWSRDHCWGPCFEVWLTTHDFAQVGEPDAYQQTFSIWSWSAKPIRSRAWSAVTIPSNSRSSWVAPREASFAMALVPRITGPTK